MKWHDDGHDVSFRFHPFEVLNCQGDFLKE